jgi:hypothetical protein
VRLAPLFAWYRRRAILHSAVQILTPTFWLGPFLPVNFIAVLPLGGRGHCIEEYSAAKSRIRLTLLC